MTSLNILLVGDESSAMRTLQQIEKTDHNVTGVVTTAPDETTVPAALWNYAQKKNYPRWDSRLVKEASFASIARDRAIDLLLNVHSLYLIHDDVLAAPKIGSFNLHPGPLPEFAGLNTVSWAILTGATDYGVTLHEMVGRIDAGRIAYESRFVITPHETALSLYSKCQRGGIPLVMQLIAQVATDPSDIPFQSQDLSRRRYFSGKSPLDGLIEWNQPAGKIDALVRACDYLPFSSPWGHPLALVDDRELTITKTSLTGITCDIAPGESRLVENKLQVATADEWLQVDRVLHKGKSVPV